MQITDNDFDKFVADVRTLPTLLRNIPIDPIAKTNYLFICLEGHISFSTDNSAFRFYFTNVLNTFIDIPRNAVVHLIKTGTPPFTTSTLWVKQSSQFTYYDLNGQAVTDSFINIKDLFKNSTIPNEDSGISDTCPRGR